MTPNAEFDVGPLSWVKGEIDLAIRRALDALKVCAATPADGGPLQSAQTSLHQAHGALQIVGLDGVTRLSEEIEALLADLGKNEASRTTERFNLAERALQSVLAYLDRLVEGNPNQSIRLYPLYREIVFTRSGQEPDPVDLYFPDLSFRPPRREAAQAALKPGEVDAYLREQRSRYQRGFLKWLKQDSVGAEEMRAAVESVESVQTTASQRAFWWVALAYFDAMLRKGLPATLDLKRMCNRIEQQIKRTVDGSPNVAERLMREALYCVAHALPVTDHVRQVREVYRLAQSLPVEGEEIVARPSPALKPVRELLARAKEEWNKFASGNAAFLPTFRDTTVAFNDAAALLGNAELSLVTQEIAALTVWLGSNRPQMSETVALEVATALLLIENALTDLSSQGPEFTLQTQMVCSRLKACAAGQPPRKRPEIPMLDEMSRRAQERLIVNRVATEMQTNLRSIEQALDAFFRDPGKRGELASLSRPMNQLLGALDMLDEQRARAALAATDQDIRRFAGADYVRDRKDFERLAQTLSGLGFYIEALTHGKADFDAVMRPVSTRRQEGEISQQVATVEEQLGAQQRETAALYEEWVKKPEDLALKAELHKNLDALQKGAELVADSALKASASEALQSLEAQAEAPASLLAEAIERIVPLSAPAPSSESSRLMAADAEAVDAEMLEVYLEEADEVLATIREHLEALRSERTNKEELTTIRRGFHTLKGSGRMVGLMRLGEAAWAVEQTLNLWLQEERAATPALLELISSAHDYFADNVASLRMGGSSSNEQVLVALAEALRRGDSPPAVTAAAVAPVADIAIEPLAETNAPAPEIADPDLASPAAPAIELELTPEIPVLEPLLPEPVAAADSLADLTLTPAPNEETIETREETIESEEETIELGGHRISTTLFAIFSGEARMHIASLKEEFVTLRQHGVVTDTMLRAAHTLAGIAGTVKLEVLRDTGYSFEHALQKLAASEVSEEEQALLGEAIDQIEGMVDSAIEVRVSSPDPDLIARLELIGARQIEAPEALIPGIDWQAQNDAATPLPAAEAPAALVDGDQGGEESEDEAAERRRRRVDDDIDPELLPILIDEGHELVPAVGTAIRDWRDHPDNPQLGQAVQRLLHTLKGSARMAGAMAIGEVTHRMESRIENALPLKTLPAMLFEDLETSYDRLGILFERLQKPGAESEEKPAPITAAPTAVPQAVEAKKSDVAVAAAVPRTAMLRVQAEVVDRLVNEAGEVAIARSRIEGEMRALKNAMQELTDNVKRLRSQLREIEIQAESQMQSRMELTKETERNFDPLEFDRFTRFQELTRLMAESVSDVQTVHQNLANAVGETEKALLAQSRLNRDLQQDLMRVRMVPFGSLTDRLYRIVRQIAKEIGKRANLEIRGTQVELDRSVLERITAPIEHLLRNAVSHGIEMPEKRRAAGKAEIGEIRLELSQEGNEVQVALSDDGAGLDLERIRAKAIERGLLDPQATLTDTELADFIFQAGFSTATEVTQISGRGVGMDVVRDEIGALGGRVELRFKRGEGARFIVYLPLTLAVTQAVLVRAGAHIYAVPSVMVEQVLQRKVDQIEESYRARHIEWNERRYPFYYLQYLLGDAAAFAEQKQFSPVLFLRSGANAVALHADEIIGSNQEIVVKAIGPQLQRIAGITGATVLGSGDIVLIINPVQLALRELSVSAATGLEAPAAPVAIPKPPEALQATIMVVDDSLTVRKVTSRLLERNGYLVVTARDGVEALEKLQEVTPGVMLVDVEMPRMDGFDLTRNVRADAHLGRIPIIMITSRTADKHRNYAMEIGVNHFLGKPYQEEELLARIAEYMSERRVTA